MLKKSENTKLKEEKGAAMVEMALFLPILFTLMIGVIDICGWLQTHLLLNRAAYEAARYAAVIPQFSDSNRDRTEIKNRFNRVVEQINLEKERLKGARLVWDETPEQGPENSLLIRVRCNYEPQFLKFFNVLTEVNSRVRFSLLT